MDEGGDHVVVVVVVVVNVVDTGSSWWCSDGGDDDADYSTAATLCNRMQLPHLGAPIFPSPSTQRSQVLFAPLNGMSSHHTTASPVPTLQPAVHIVPIVVTKECGETTTWKRWHSRCSGLCGASTGWLTRDYAFLFTPVLHPQASPSLTPLPKFAKRL
ncbi:hypothetical protein BOTBODRAFT_179753 [Botryobasidium botryosum FD-172 SS1]|uniref:Uncharacterized protein n=1 Tax=Botryobasidium botryosum (strain FD-172 SS1) TaxID=930990 RepID=A0A067LYN9_BOTB1|nr:hypothetical protein BOTBODRAFT_179753 [Botryobasidium botryosum FD-172 SS1]